MGFSTTTFLFEVLNFAVLLFILRALVYKPLQRGIESRREALAAEGAAAERARADAERLRGEVEARLAEVDRMREDVLREAREEAEAERARIVAQAREEARTEHKRIERLLAREREAALETLREATVERSVELAGALVQELAGDGTDATLTRALAEELRRRPELVAGEGNAARDGAVRAELVVARRASQLDVEPLAKELERALGRRVEIDRREDASLGAGAVLRVGGRVLDASLAGRLSALRARARELLEERDGGA